MIGTEANWRHNFVDGIVVELQVAGERVSGHAVQITDDSAKRNRLGRMLTGLGWLLFSGSLTIIDGYPGV